MKSSLKVKIVGTFDMNGDGLIDILYTDELKNVIISLFSYIVWLTVILIISLF
jgi:hypothetical protein